MVVRVTGVVLVAPVISEVTKQEGESNDYDKYVENITVELTFLMILWVTPMT